MSAILHAVNVMIVDDHSIVRAGLAAIVAREPGIFICAECEDAEQAVRAAQDMKPDLAIVDLMLGKESALPLFRRLLQFKPDLRILALSMHDEAIYAPRVIQAGAHGYVMKDTGLETLRDAIHTVMKGDLYVSDKMRSQLLRSLAGGAQAQSADDVSQLTASELAVLQMIGAGLSMKEIADKQRRSQKTVEAHRNNIRLKLRLPSAPALVHFASQWVHAHQ